MTSTADLIKNRLNDLEPISIDVFDDSAAHEGHTGVKETGGGHFELAICSKAFTSKNTVQRHRMIYERLSDLMPGTIHALSIHAIAPEE